MYLVVFPVPGLSTIFPDCTTAEDKRKIESLQTWNAVVGGKYKSIGESLAHFSVTEKFL
jgi:hypothetical protein